MHRLTRQVRFSLTGPDDTDLARDKPVNGHAGFPAHRSTLARFYQVDVTLEGTPAPATGYLRNIKDLDAAVRDHAVKQIVGLNYLHEHRTPHAGFTIGSLLFRVLRDKFPDAAVHAVTLHLTPYVSITQFASELDMSTRLSTKFEFSATHRLHNPALSDDENRKCFGKCNNPHGHGHNYELQVTLTGPTDPDGLLRRLPEIEQTVAKTVLDKFDHKNLNAELPEFKDLNPSVENIAMVIYRLLKPHFNNNDATLASVTVWETPKTWCEYSE